MVQPVDESLFRLHLAEGPVSDWVAGPDGCRSAAAGLRVQVTRTPRGPATEYVTTLTNLRDQPSPLMTRVCFFRRRWAIDRDDVPVVHHSGGGLTDAVFPSSAWRVERSELLDWSTLRLEGARGRSSNRDLPIFIVTDEADTHGVAFVAGYSGHVLNAVIREVDY